MLAYPAKILRQLTSAGDFAIDIQVKGKDEASNRENKLTILLPTAEVSRRRNHSRPDFVSWRCKNRVPT